MQHTRTKAPDQVLDAESTAGPAGSSPDTVGPEHSRILEPHAAAATRTNHPVVLVDARPLTLFAIRRLRRHGVPVHVYSERLLEPCLFARGVVRHRLPPLRSRPDLWIASFLELSALIEPRPVLVPCSKRGRDLLLHAQHVLHPHFELAHLETLELRDDEAEEFRSERVLRRTIVRGEPAFEVQVTLDTAGNCNAACILTWVAGVPPHLVVTSVAGNEVLERSLEWLRARRLRGYARLIWAPDRFGRVDLQAVGTLPGSGWTLALEDGVDFPLMWYASLAGVGLPAQFARHTLSRQIRVSGLDADGSMPPLISPPEPRWREDPVAALAALAHALQR